MYAPITTQNPYQPSMYMPYTHTWPHPQQYPWKYETNNIPLLKNYEINISGPFANHNKVSDIYENIFPTKDFGKTFENITGRLSMNRYIRSSLIRKTDGEHIGLSGTEDHNLLSYLKFMDINPYGSNTYSNNPYSNLPRNLLIYRSCYPIKYDRKNGTVVCAKNSIGINIRIYPLTHQELSVETNKANNEYLDVWNEKSFYEYIKENIIKTKKCPNFVIKYAHFICDDSKIDFDSLMQAVGKPVIHPPKTIPDPHNDAVQIQNPDAFSGKALIMLTESATHSLTQWQTSIYRPEGVVKTMIHTGFHNEHEWYSVLFQIFAGIHALRKSGIAFSEFSVENNIFIKDLRTYTNAPTYWKYIIDGRTYYVPNYGYLVLIDSKYADVSTPNKIFTNKFTVNKQYNSKTILDYSLESFAQCVDIHNYKQTDSVFPPEEIIMLIGSIDEDLKKDVHEGNKLSVSHYIHKFMRKLLNNRIGTYMSESEIIYINKGDKTKFERGEIIAMEVKHEIFKYVMYDGSDNKSAKILTRVDSRDIDLLNEITDKTVSFAHLYKISKHERIIQKIVNGLTFNGESLHETYLI